MVTPPLFPLSPSSSPLCAAGRQRLRGFLQSWARQQAVQENLCIGFLLFEAKIIKAKKNVEAQEAFAQGVCCLLPSMRRLSAD